MAEMSAIDFLECATFFTVGGALIGWQLRSIELDRLRAWKKEAVKVLRDCKPHLERVFALEQEIALKTFLLKGSQNAVFRHEVTIKEFRKRLSKFHQIRGERGRFASRKSA